ncbi:hypothetical protein TWF281_003712 [Arthrobotrys megalospora]
MTSLLTLSLAPELLDDILLYLSQKDVCALIRTCKSLYPACYRHLWSVLVFHRDGRPWYPEHRLNENKFGSLFRALRTRSSGNPGFKYTRVLWLGELILDQSDPTTQNIRKILKGLLDSGELNLRHAVVTFGPEYSDEVNFGVQPEGSDILLSLKRHAESKSRRALSMKLQTDDRLLDNKLLTKYFCLSIITDFALYVGHNLWSFASQDFTLAIRATSNIKDLARAITSMVNLQRFYWSSSPSQHQQQLAPLLGQVGVSIWEPLMYLQAAFSGLQHLTFMQLDGYVFHPHFFLDPPDSVTEVMVLRNMMPGWWQKFAVLPLSNVKSLVIHTQAGAPFPRLCTIDQVQAVAADDFVIEDIAVRGLRHFMVFGEGYIPPGLYECILRNNAGLDNESIQQLQARRGLLMATGCHQRLESRAQAAAKVLSGRLPSQFSEATRSEASLRQEVMQEYTRIFHAAPRAPKDTRQTDEAWLAVKNRVKRELLRRVDICTSLMLDQYALRYPSVAAARNLQEPFLSDCLHSMRDPSDAEYWISAKGQIRDFADESLVGMQKQINGWEPALRYELTESLLAGKEADMESTVEDWIPTLIEAFEEEQAIKRR